MKISNILSDMAKTKTAQKFYKWCCEPKSEKFLNNNLPQLETILSTSCYVYSTARQKDIDAERKELLQYQNIGSGILGLGISSWANRKVGKLGEAVIKDLDTTKIDPKAIRQITTGIRIAIPLTTTALCMRCVLPAIIAGFSGKIMDKKREQQAKKQAKLDVQG